MTLIVALQGRDGLVLAADSRGTIGDPRGLTAITDDQTKLFRLSRYCGIGVSGASELASKVVDDLNGVIAAGKHEYADDILGEARQLVRSSYDDWFGKFPVGERPGLLLIVVGLQKGRTAPSFRAPTCWATRQTSRLSCSRTATAWLASPSTRSTSSTVCTRPK